MSCGKSCDCPTYNAHLRSIAFAPSAMPSRHSEAAQARDVSKSWEKDLPAYKRLVESGLQPPSTAGTAELEAKASLPIEVESGVVMNKTQRREYESVTQ